MPEPRHEPRTYDWRADVRARLAGAGLRPEDEAQIVEEIGHHLDQQFEELLPRIGAAAARERLLEQLRDERFDEAIAGRRRRAAPSKARVWSSSSVVHDIRYGLRSLRRSPGTLIAGSAALALGIGLTTTMFSVIYGLLIKGLPYDEPSRIAVVKFIDPKQPGVDALVPLADLDAYRARQRSFVSLGGYAVATVNVSGGDRPDRVTATRVTAGTVDITGVRPLLGRTFGRGDVAANASPTAILSYALWRDRFAANPNAIGTALRVNGLVHTVVGVMPPEFQFPAATKVWLPLPTQSAVDPTDGSGVSLVGRLRADASYDNANVEFRELGRQIAAARPAAADTNLRIAVLPFVRAAVNPRIYTLLYAMLAAVMLVLLVACANVANLLLERAVNRSRELGIRTALGASRLAVMRQSLVESGILATIAACAGAAIAQLGIVLFNRSVAEVPAAVFWMDVRLHPPVLAFVVVVAVVASLVSGLLPAIQSSRLDVAAILKDESNGVSSLRVGRLSRAIVVVQIAVSAAVLLASGYITRSIVNLRNVDPRFETRGITTARVALATDDTARQRAFFEKLERDIEQIPGGAGVSLGSGLPGTGWQAHHATIEGETYRHDRDHPVVRTLGVAPGFFQTFGVHVLRGRAIVAADVAAGDRVAVVSESFARRVLHGRDPMGARFRASADSTAPWLTVVGVVPTLFSSTIDDPWPAEVLTPFSQQISLASAALAFRGDPAGAAVALRRIVAAIDPEVPVYGVESMTDVMAQPMLFFDVFAAMFAVFGVAALVLSAIGLYAVMTFSVSRRAREMGIRLALGASGGAVLRMIVRQGARQTALGMAIGFLLGLVVVRAIAAALFGVRPSDPVVIAAVAGVLGVSAMAACLVPARRATRVDPVVALRSD